jgi:hypothetical protein
VSALRQPLALALAGALLAPAAQAAVTVTFAPANLPVPVVAVPFGVQFSGNGGRPPYAFFISAGRLPSGLGFSLAGLLAGTPVTALPYAFNVVALDGDGRSGLRTLSGEVDSGAPKAQPQSLSVPEDMPLPITLVATDLNSPSLTYAVAPADAPDHGTLAGTPPSVTYQPAPDYFGPDDFQFTASDGTLASTPALVGITVLPVNDAPAFDGGPDVTALRSSGPVALPGWAVLTSRGAANESGQQVQFVVTTNTRPGLFAVAPAVAPDGTLAFTPSGSAGVAALTVEARDDGGTANGGVDRSAPYFFTIALQSPGTDLSVHITGPASYVDNAPLQFTVRVENAGPSTATAASVDVSLPPQLTNAQWACAPVAPATCTASGSGNIADAVTIPANGSVTYTVQSTVVANGTGVFAVDAQVAPGANQADPDPSDDADQHVFSVDAIFRNGFEG